MDRAEEIVGELLKARGLTLCLAESCTGGLLAHRVTNVSGSSTYFLGGVVAYANQVKENLLGVSGVTLQQHGAVSRETAIEMAQGARRVLGGDVALSVTGIAGPTGGTVEKPVGLTYIALAAKGYEECEKNLWQEDRLGNKECSVDAALEMLIRYLRGVES
ncbi:MAG: CinA family protein [Anaerolineae bacterium]